MENLNPTVKNIKPLDMIDRTVLLPPTEDGSRYRARILDIVYDYKSDFAKEREKNPCFLKFRCLVNNEKEEVIAYNDIVDYIEDDWT